MELEALFAEYRRQADDNASPQLTSNATLFDWVNEAEREAAIRASLLFDDTSSFLSIAVVAGTHTYPLDARIHAIENASLQLTAGGRPTDLDLVGMDKIQSDCDWKTKTGRPRYAVHRERLGLRLWPTPSEYYAGTLSLEVYRYPFEKMIALDDEPEIPEEHHLGLVDWLLWRTFSQKDGEQYDPGRANDALGRFEQRFGERDSADVMRRKRERSRVTTTYGGL
ncbi:hypothetical protein [uncultured Arenimonas sp.]|uniref:phage adaptor protein n=1 Tax=uncultured Arenimonas sp. TaxID=546226 RepID=UPI0030DA22C3